MKKANPIFLFFAAMVFSFTYAQAADSTYTSTRGIFDVLSYQERVDIDLTFDLDEVFMNRRSEQEYKAAMTFKDESGAEQRWEIKLSVRGKYRRLMCNETPPLRIDFKKGDLEKAGLAKFDDMKLVTYCIGHYQTAKELLLREYLAYKLYSKLSDFSYRVQLVNITYRDINSGKRKKQLGFLIEDTAQLKARLEAGTIEAERIIDAEKFHPEYRKVTALFQYMIGNADWGITHAKNVNYLLKNEEVIPVPYDFDFSALVGAPYATPVSFHGQASIYDRVYLGFERSTEELTATAQYFSDKKETLLAVVDDFRALRRKSRREVTAYLESFYDDVQDIKFSDKWF